MLRDSFIIRIELRDLSVLGNPPPTDVEGFVVALTGFLQEEKGGLTGLPAKKRLVNAYRVSGVTVSAAVLGHYAAVIVDREAKRVLLIQDSLGLRTLFYVLAGSHLTVSSDVRTLLAATRTTNLNPGFFAEFLSGGQKPHLQTPYSGVSRLGLGHTVIIQNARASSFRPWSPPKTASRAQLPLVEAKLRSLLDEAAATMVPREGTVLCDLSGGLDSTTVLMSALKLRDDIQALALIGSRRLTGDEKYARQLAEGLGLRWHTIDIDSNLPYSLLPDVAAGEPGDEHVLPFQMARLELLERTQAKVALTGHFGDALFGSSGGLLPFHLADPISVGQLLKAVRLARNWRDYQYGHRTWLHPLIYFGLSTAWRHWRKQSLRRHYSQPPDWLTRSFVRQCGLDRGVVSQSVPRVREAGKQYLWENAYHTARLLSSDYRTCAGADVRHPLMHRPLVEFMLGLDSELRFNSHTDRLLQRRALRDRLPPTILGRTTKGRFQEIYDRAFMHSDWLRMLSDSPKLVERGWVDGPTWTKTVARAGFGVVTRRQEFDAAVTTECWLRNREKQLLSASPTMYKTVVVSRTIQRS
jgi:asparagine synthase (glutamine-hydrolysing)